jgi:23S rRNA (cytosine1962-C5)-methyltransferase
MPALILKPDRQKSLLRRHPWLFSGAVARVEGQVGMGETVAVRAANGDFLAWGAYSPQSQIAVRFWSFDPKEVIGPEFFRRRLERALAHPARRGPTCGGQSACRLVHAESDGLPGLILDRYGDTLVAQFLAAGAEFWRDPLADLALELTGAARIFDRSDVDVRELEGLPPRVASLRGDEPLEAIVIEEAGLQLLVDVRRGHKTGFYLDQRPNRERVRSWAAGRAVLDCFCYTGGFTVNVLKGGAASVVAVDASGEALSRARQNVALNALPLDQVSFLEGDVFQVLRKFRDSRQSFDLIVLDPPKFAQTASQVEQAARGYKDINLLAFKLLRPGGLLVTFSCSGGISDELFQKIVAGAALDAGVEAQIVEHLHQGADHPVALNFPEGAYLKGLVLRG